MFETAIADGADQFGLEQEVAETSRVNAHIAALLVDTGTGCELALLGVGGGSLIANLLVGVVDEVFLVRHDVGVERCWVSCRMGTGKLLLITKELCSQSLSRG